MEFALVLPMLLLIFLGVVDLGRLIFASSEVANAAREGVRTAIVNQNLSDIRERTAQQAISLGIPTAAPNGCPTLGGPTTDSAGTCVVFDDPPAMTTNCGTPYVGCVAVVTVKYTFRPITPIVSAFVSSIPVVSQSEQPIESLCTGAGACPIP